MTTRNSQASTTVEQTKPTSTPQRQEARQQPTVLQPPSPAVTASAHSAPKETVESEKPEQIQRITKSPTEQDPYLIKLAVHLAKELEKLRVPALAQLDRSKEMTLELRILPNGALTRARIKESTGMDNIDRAAHRAALSASPYPKPNGETSDRFDVKLVFTPKRSSR
ncbi:TonB family protein [Marinobacter sp. SBS5]|uniref:TonB family protein n=1 Tax=Marinobacter sp. SBS5 TaxID=3401754 RepID=UPI003AAEB7E6